MSEIEKIERYIALTKTHNRYGMNLNEALAIAHDAKNNPISAISLAFEYGRAKGYRAANAEARHE